MPTVLLLLLIYPVLVYESGPLPLSFTLPSLVPVYLVGAASWRGEGAVLPAVLLGFGLDGLAGSGFGTHLLFCTGAALVLNGLRDSDWLTTLPPMVLVLFCVSLAFAGLEPLIDLFATNEAAPIDSAPGSAGERWVPLLSSALAATGLGFGLLVLGRLRVVWVESHDLEPVA